MTMKKETSDKSLSIQIQAYKNKGTVPKSWKDSGKIIAGIIWNKDIEFTTSKECECYHSSHSPYMFGLSPRMYDSNVRFSTVAQSKSRRS